MTSRNDRLAVLIGLAAFCLCTIAVALSSVHVLHDADTLIPVFASIERWQSFYWEQDRFGALLPLLAKPVSDYRWNAIFQTFLTVAGAALSLVILCIWIDSREVVLQSRHLAIACFAAALMALCLRVQNAIGSYLMLPGSPYFSSLGLLLCGAHLLRNVQRYRLFLLGFFLVCLAAWINISHAVLAAFLVFALPRTSILSRAAAAAAVAAAGTLNFAASRQVADVAGHLTYSTTTSWPIARAVVTDLLDHIGAYMVYPQRALALAAAAVATAFFLLSNRALRFSLHRILLLTVVTLAFGVFISQLSWVYRNGAESRYLATPVFLTLAILALTIATSMFHLLTRAGLPALPVVALQSTIAVTVFIAACGVPSITRALNSFDIAPSFSPDFQRQLKATGCNMLVGDYWTVWPALFHLRMDGDTNALPITFRSRPLLPRINAVPQNKRVYCGLCDDSTINEHLQRFAMPPLKQSKRHGSLCVYEPR